MALNEEVNKKIEEFKRARERNRERILCLFLEVGDHYLGRGSAELNLYQDNDVHAFYRLNEDKSKVVHVQGYPGMSSQEKMHVWARLINYDLMMVIRDNSCTSPGNEHSAVIKQFENFEFGIEIPYEARALEKLLEENVPELK